MNCDEANRLLEIDLDGELELVRHLELSTHLQSCPRCSARVLAIQERNFAIRRLPRFTAPPALLTQVRAALHAERSTSPAPEPHPSMSRPVQAARRFAPSWVLLGLAASIAVSLIAGYAVGDAHAKSNRLFAEAIDEHVSSLQAAHLTDVTSTDQHTVKPWFAGKLDFSPPVVDLASAGFPLIGGRLDRLGGHSVAALVFRRHQHFINVFVWPSEDRLALNNREADQSGYHSESWSSNGFNFLAISDVSKPDLADLKNRLLSAR